MILSKYKAFCVHAAIRNLRYINATLDSDIVVGGKVVARVCATQKTVIVYGPHANDVEPHADLDAFTKAYELE